MSPKGMSPDRAEKVNEVMRLKRDAKSFRAIADELDISVSTAHRYYKEGVRETYRHATEELVETQHQRLEQLYRSFLPNAVDGDVDSANVCLKINEQVSKLFGLNGVIKLDVQGGAAEQFAELLTTLRGKE